MPLQKSTCRIAYNRVASNHEAGRRRPKPMHVTIHQDESLALAQALPADRHPAAVYLARLAPGSRRTMASSLDTIAGLLTQYGCNARTVDWSALRYQHTAAVRAMLAELYAPATA